MRRPEGQPRQRRLLSTTIATDFVRPVLSAFSGVQLSSLNKALTTAILCDDVLILSSNEASEVLAASAKPSIVPVVILWTDAPDAVPATLAANPHIVALIGPASSQLAIATAIRAAFLIHDSRQDHAATQALERVLAIGRALTSEKDLDRLFALVLTNARELTHADGASIYTVDAQGHVFFRLMQNASSLPMASTLTRVSQDSIAGHVARTGESLTLDDVYGIAADAPYRFDPAMDVAHGYRTRSLLTLPLTNKRGRTVGVLQLVNRKDHTHRSLENGSDVERYVGPFREADQLIAMALAGQAGVALENSMLYEDIERLFEGFIHASVKAIEARDPSTAGHSFRVADFTDQLARAVDHDSTPVLRDIVFDREQLRELRYAALLHDFGKVGVREHVLVKAKKLHPHQLEMIRLRCRYARACLDRAAYRALLETPPADHGARQQIERNLAARRSQLDAHLQAIIATNEPTDVSNDVGPDVAEAVRFFFLDETDMEIPLLHPYELSDLSSARGSLTPDERDQIKSHVSHTYAFLRLIPWTDNLARLPDIAHAHHEKLDGSGYPRGLSGTAIPVQSRILTICDIFDALTAGDRPYKRALPPDVALDILATEVRQGRVDGDLFRVFVESGAYHPISLTN